MFFFPIDCLIIGSEGPFCSLCRTTSIPGNCNAANQEPQSNSRNDTWITAMTVGFDAINSCCCSKYPKPQFIILDIQSRLLVVFFRWVWGTWTVCEVVVGVSVVCRSCLVDRRWRLSSYCGLAAVVSLTWEVDGHLYLPTWFVLFLESLSLKQLVVVKNCTSFFSFSIFSNVAWEIQASSGLVDNNPALGQVISASHYWGGWRRKGFGTFKELEDDDRWWCSFQKLLIFTCLH